MIYIELEYNVIQWWSSRTWGWNFGFCDSREFISYL